MDEFLIKALAGVGFPGIVLGGLIWFVGRRLFRLEEAWDRHTRMELMRLIASREISTEVKAALTDQLKEVEVAETRRKKP